MQPQASKTKRHFAFSIAKSGLRIIGCGALCLQSFVAAGALLGVAEILGILEEM